MNFSEHHKISLNSKGLRESALNLIILLVIFIPRIPALDTFVTVDEATWLMRSGNFYYALTHQELEKTVSAYHPAVTTMWTGTLGILAEFPEYRGQGQSYFIKEWKFKDFLLEFEQNPLEILETSRFFTVVINGTLIFILFHLARKILGLLSASLIILFLSFDPYFLGHTRILAHEGMMSSFMLVSLFAMLVYFHEGERKTYLVLSAVAGGLAALTKSSATIVIFYVGALVLINFTEVFKPRKTGRERRKILTQALRIQIFWVAIFGITYVLFWPGMWVKPLEMLYQVYGNAASYALQGQNLTAFEYGFEPVPESRLAGLIKYFLAILWRTTPVVWFGFLLSLTTLFGGFKDADKKTSFLLTFFLTTGLIFALIMATARGRRASHYIMFTFVCLDIITALGFSYLISRIKTQPRRLIFWLSTSLVSLSLLIHILSPFPFSPYFFNYTNPIMKQIPWGQTSHPVGYGEGLEVAAQYLAQKPRAAKSTVLSWYGFGPFSYFYPGETLNLARTFWSTPLIDRLKRADSLVIYVPNQLNANTPAKLLRDLERVVPEHTIWLNDVEYIRIYDTSELPEETLIPDKVP